MSDVAVAKTHDQRAADLIASFPWVVRDDGVVVLPDKLPEVTKGGIHLANQAQRPLTGTVVAVGPGRRVEVERVLTTRHAADFTAGDRAFFAQYAGQTLTVEGCSEPLVLLRFEDVRMIAKKG